MRWPAALPARDDLEDFEFLAVGDGVGDGDRRLAADECGERCTAKSSNQGCIAISHPMNDKPAPIQANQMCKSWLTVPPTSKCSASMSAIQDKDDTEDMITPIRSGIAESSTGFVRMTVRITETMNAALKVKVEGNAKE